MNTKVLVIAAALIIVGGVAAIAIYQQGGQPSCVKPENGFLIIASARGFNDSIDRNLSQPWPLISVPVGSTVHIVVCNDDVVAHGFQVDHYYTGSLVSIAPNQVLQVSFAASQTGVFRVYCQIPCPVHFAMQNGRLVVS